MAYDRWAAEWERFGRDNPYFGVLNRAEFRGARPDAAARASFFQTGEDEVARVFHEIHQHVAANFEPARTLDFGCGVGRLSLPLARRSSYVVGVDLARAMLDEARRNAEEQGVHNVDFELSNDAQPSRSGPVGARTTRDGGFDLIHSYIVFQHIPPARGLAITRRLLERLAPEGIAALHFTYGRRASRWRRAVHAVHRSARIANVLANVLRGLPPGAPMTPMFFYDLAAVLEILLDAGCTTAFIRQTDHGGYLGVMLYARKDRSGATPTSEK